MKPELTVKHYSIRTETQFVQWIRRFILFHDKRHPRNLRAPEVEAFLTYLAVEGKNREIVLSLRAAWVAEHVGWVKPEVVDGLYMGTIVSGMCKLNYPHCQWRFEP